MKIATIGDIHGHSSWKALIEGYDPDTNTGTKYHIDQFDKVIFIGDYVDSFSVDNLSMKHNLIEIIELKKKHLDKIILLLGNHDLQYLLGFKNHGCSGYRPEMSSDFADIFRNNRKIFIAAFQYKNYIWTHAGIHIGWYKMKLEPWIKEFKKNEDVYLESFDIKKEDDSIAFWINTAFKMNKQFLFDVGYIRCGRADVGGPFWLDKNNGYKKPLEGYHQIVGHTVVDTIKVFEKDENTSITFIDCLGKDIYNFHIIDI